MTQPLDWIGLPSELSSVLTKHTFAWEKRQASRYGLATMFIQAATRTESRRDMWTG